MKLKYIQLMSICACLLFTTSSVASITPLSQNRTLSCYAFAEDLNGSDSYGESTEAADFDPFVEGVGATIYLDAAYASGSAHQTSSIEPTLFDVVGGCAANGEAYEFEGYGDARGSTFFECQFEISAATPFALTGYLEASDDGDASLSLNGPGTSLYLDAGFNNILDLNESGELAPGIYTFTVEANSSAFGDYSYYGYAYGGFDLELAFTSTSAAPISGSEGMALQLSPNPFSQQTEIAFSAPARQASSLEIFDLRGHLVRRLVTGGRENGGLIWDGRNSRGQAVATGTYFVVLKSGNEIRREKAILVR